MKQANLLKAAREMIKATNYRAAMMISGSPEQREFATDKFWEAHDNLGKAIAEAENENQDR